MPDFIIIGAVKAGTTSVYHYLKQHPEIVMSREKWTRFFHVDGPVPDFDTLAANYGGELLQESKFRFSLMCHPGIPRTIDAYKLMWPDDTAPGIMKGEVSPTYFYDRNVPERIRARFPGIKLLVILRQPADRAYSHYIMDLTHGWVPEQTFLKALEREPFRVDEFWWGLRHYLRHGLYARRLEHLFTLFGRDQVGVFIYDDFKQNPEQFMKDIFIFLGVDSYVPVDMSVLHNQGLVKTRGATPMELVKPPPLDRNIRKSLTEMFRPDIVHLQQVLGRNMSAWLM